MNNKSLLAKITSSLILLLVLSAMSGAEVKYTPLDLPHGVEAFPLDELKGKSEAEVVGMIGQQDEGMTLEEHRQEIRKQGVRLRPGVGLGTVWRYGPLLKGQAADDVIEELKYITIWFNDGIVISTHGELSTDLAIPLDGSDEMVNTLFPRIVDLRWYPPTVKGKLGSLRSFEVKIVQEDCPDNVKTIATEVPHIVHVFGGAGRYIWHVRCKFENGDGQWRRMGSVVNRR